MDPCGLKLQADLRIEWQRISALFVTYDVMKRWRSPEAPEALSFNQRALGERHNVR
jgi:hypothetical protein